MQSSVSVDANIAALFASLGVGFAFFIFFFILALVAMAIVAYIFQSLAFYRFMLNRNIENAFLAWIPIVRAYAVGKVYDDINEKQGKKTNFGIILLILNCVYWLGAPFLSKVSILAFVYAFGQLGLGLAVFVLHLICFNLIFKKYAPGNSTYFVLTIIFSIIPIVPFIPGLCLLKASKNQPVSETDNE